MNRHAKASSAGPNTRQASRLRRIFRGAFATRAASSDSKGSGAPLTARRSKLLLGAGAGLLLTLALGVTLATAVAPVVTVKDATNVQYTTADVEGTVKPEGQLTEWRFQYITDAAFQDNIANTLPGFEGATTGPEGATEADETLERQLTDLSPATTYHLRLFAQNGDGPSEEVAASTFKTKVVTAPSVTVQDASSVTGSTAHFAGTVNPGNANAAFDSSCAFDYATQAQFDADGFASASQIDCDVNPVSATEPPEPIDVQANPTNLLANTTYHLRLRAQNLGGTTAPEAAGTFATLAIAPVIHHTSVVGVTSSQATLHAEINPGGDPTTYRFQYMTEAAYEAAGNSFSGAIQTPSLPLPGAADNSDHLAPANLSGLQADTSYRYQAIATNSVGSTEGDGREHVLHTYALPGEEIDTCPNAKLRAEQHSAVLPDCRAYEQASPADKNGGDVNHFTLRSVAAADGSAFAFTSLNGFGDAHGTAVGTEYIAKRGPGGSWTTHGITPVQDSMGFSSLLFGIEFKYELFSEDLSKGVFRSWSPLSDAPNAAEAMNLYRRDDMLTSGEGSYSLLSDASSPQAGDINLQPQVTGASADFSHVTFESTRNLTPETAGLDPSEPKLYEWAEGSLRLAGILPADEGGGPTISQAGQGRIAPAFSRYTEGTISRDGRRVIFTGPPFEVGSGEHVAGVLYERDDQGTPATGDDATVRVSASERTDCNDDPTCGGDDIPDPTPDPGGTAQPATFGAASADGAKIFFTTPEQLTDDDVNGARDLYRFDAEAPAGSRLTRISVDEELSDNGGDPRIGRETTGVIGASSDGSYVYFTAAGQLVAGGPTGDTGGPISGARIFVWHNGALREVGAINRGFEGDAVAGKFGINVLPKTSRLSPDGAHLAFMSEGTEELLSLYGRPEYDHGTSCIKSLGDPECLEVYVYDATANGGAGDLQCASCNPSGQAATADANFYGEEFLIGAITRTFHLNRAISDDGRFVFFNSAEALVPDDSNGIEDAYEYDTETEEVHLLSSGTDPGISTFLDASADGRDVFFITRAQLRGSDGDQSDDLYDARVGGGSPEPTPVPAPCAGDQCRGAVSSPPHVPGAASATFSGPGDRVERRHHKHKRRHHRKRHHNRQATGRHG